MINDKLYCITNLVVGYRLSPINYDYTHYIVIYIYRYWDNLYGSRTQRKQSLENDHYEGEYQIMIFISHYQYHHDHHHHIVFISISSRIPTSSSSSSAVRLCWLDYRQLMKKIQMERILLVLQSMYDDGIAYVSMKYTL